MKQPKYLTKLTQISELKDSEVEELNPVTDNFIFRANDYYMGLIDWNDPHDPVRQLIVPSRGELGEWGTLDASEEEKYTRVKGLEHKYADTALLLVNDVCGGYCRFCFRKRLFMEGNDEVVRDISEGLRYIRENKQITNVLLTGGDPLVLSTEKLELIVRQLREIDHVSIIRIGTKMPAFSPARILNDPSLTRMIKNNSTDTKKIYIMLHFNHPRELTAIAIEGLNCLLRAGAIMANQTPLIRGINDDPEVLVELFNRMSFVGVPPYYVFQCRPTLGNQSFSVPLEEAYDIFTKAHAKGSGLAKRARFVMSHTTGKIEVVGKADGRIYFRYHQAADPAENGAFFSCKLNPDSYWLDDYEEFKPKTTSPSDDKAMFTCIGDAVRPAK